MSDYKKTGSETLNMDSFNPKKAELIALAEKHKAATEIEIIDKETYEQVHSAQIVLRDTRNDIKSQGLAIRENANKFIKQVTTAEKELLEIITPIEDILIAKKDAWKKKEEEEKERKRQEQEALTNKRVQELAQYGYVHDLFDLKIMEEEAFQNLLSEKKSAFETAENERKAREAAENRKNERMNKVMRIGATWNPEVQAYYSYELQAIVMTQEAFEQFTDEGFEEALKTISERIETKRAEIKNQQEAMAARQKEIDDRDAEIKRKEAEQKKAEDDKKRADELEAARKQAEKETEERLKKEADDKKKADEEAQKAEQARLAKEKKYKEFLASIGYTPENKDEFTFIDTDAGRVFYKKVGTYEK